MGNRTTRTTWLALVTAATLAVPLAAARPAHADRPWTGYTEVDRGPASPPADIGPGLVIFLNKSGGTYKPGNDNSRTNTTGIAVSSSTISALSCSEAVWQQVVACVKDQFSPFNVTITDVDPGNSPHVESVVAGSPGQLKTQQYPQGLPCGSSGCVGGIAPLGCYGGVDNAITFTFGNIYQCDAQSICETVAQETAHAFGLDHENYCPDPMTYQTGCGDKKFKDYDAPCGEYSNRQCQCPGAGSTQNSHQELLALFGPAGAQQDDAPTLQILQPANGAVVAPGFAIEGSAADDISLARVELWIDGGMVAQKATGPFVFSAPQGLAGGNHAITMRAVDGAGQQTDQSVNVDLQVMLPPAGCQSDAQCGAGQICDTGSGDCVAAPGDDGELGTPCSDNSDCTSGLCGSGPGGMRCTAACVPGGADCPAGFDCLPTGGAGGACWPSTTTPPPATGGDGDLVGSCGCRAGGAARGAPLAGFILAFAGLALSAHRRRRR